MNPYFLGEAKPLSKHNWFLGQIASLERYGRHRVRVALDAIPLRWAQELWQSTGGDAELSPERISSFFETAPFFKIKTTLDRESSRSLLDLLLYKASSSEAPAPLGFLGQWVRVHFEVRRRGNAICYSSVADTGTAGSVYLLDPAPQDVVRYLNTFKPPVKVVTHDDPELLDELDKIRPPHAMAVLDVGQGSANVMLDELGKPLLYFDAGRGTLANFGTAPAGLKFCVCSHDNNPLPVLLSHWHEDHYLGTLSDPDLLMCTWYTPPAATLQHMAFQNSILLAGSKVYQLLPAFPNFQFGTSGSYTLAKCTGNVNNPNEVGHALKVEQQDRRWLLPADASYTNIPLPSEEDFTAVVASHHGGRFKKNFVPNRSPGYARMVYSFGPSNSYKHPKAASVTKHAIKWNHSNWKGAAKPGVTPPSTASDVRATAIHGVLPLPGVLPIHAGAVAVGWQGPPSIAALTGPCPTCGKSFNILQN